MSKLKTIYKILNKPRKAFNKSRVGKAIRRQKKERLWNSIEQNKESITVVPNKIAIATNTDAYTCNPKYIYEEIIKRNLNYKIVWLTAKNKVRSGGFPDNIKTLSIQTEEGIKAAYSSKIWIDNGIFFSNYFEKRPEQIHIQTMHGSLGIKRLDNAVLCRNRRGEKGQRVVWRESNNTNYVITDSKFEEDVFRTVFWENTPMVRLGHARTDALFNVKQTEVERIRDVLFERYGITQDKKILLYAPTHRKELTIDNLEFNFNKVAEALNNRFGEDYAILVRMHKRTKNVDWADYKAKNNADVLYDVTDYPDIQELMNVTDVAMTDYSSWIFDYVLTRKKGLIFAADQERYNTNTGLCYPLTETPFPVASNEEELINNILNFDDDKYSDKVESFLKNKEAVDDGHSAERIVDWIETLMEENNK